MPKQAGKTFSNQQLTMRVYKPLVMIIESEQKQQQQQLHMFCWGV
jgi:hypothetical protein